MLANDELVCTDISDSSTVSATYSELIDAHAVVICSLDNSSGRLPTMYFFNVDPIVNNPRQVATYVAGSFTLSVAVFINFTTGKITVKCSTNTWGLDTISVYIRANSIIYTK